MSTGSPDSSLCLFFRKKASEYSKLLSNKMWSLITEARKILCWRRNLLVYHLNKNRIVLYHSHIAIYLKGNSLLSFLNKTKMQRSQVFLGLKALEVC